MNIAGDMTLKANIVEKLREIEDQYGQGLTVGHYCSLLKRDSEVMGWLNELLELGKQKQLLKMLGDVVAVNAHRQKGWKSELIMIDDPLDACRDMIYPTRYSQDQVDEIQRTMLLPSESGSFQQEPADCKIKIECELEHMNFSCDGVEKLTEMTMKAGFEASMLHNAILAHDIGYIKDHTGLSPEPEGDTPKRL